MNSFHVAREIKALKRHAAVYAMDDIKKEESKILTSLDLSSEPKACKLFDDVDLDLSEEKKKIFKCLSGEDSTQKYFEQEEEQFHILFENTKYSLDANGHASFNTEQSTDYRRGQELHVDRENVNCQSPNHFIATACSFRQLSAEIESSSYTVTALNDCQHIDSSDHNADMESQLDQNDTVNNEMPFEDDSSLPDFSDAENIDSAFSNFNYELDKEATGKMLNEESQFEDFLSNMMDSYIRQVENFKAEVSDIEEEQRKLEERFKDELDRINNNPVNEREEEYLNFKPEDIKVGEQVLSENEKNGHRPLYPGATITVAVSVMLIMTFSIRHGLSGTGLTDLLELISLHCLQPVASNALKSIFHFKKYFQNLKTPLVIHKYCSNCLFLIQTEGQDVYHLQ